MHGEKDFRVPVTQGIEYYNTLRIKGVPTRLSISRRESLGAEAAKLPALAPGVSSPGWRSTWAAGRHRGNGEGSQIEQVTVG